jgi:hypothetical protein
MMTEYATTTAEGVRQRDAFIVESGEYFWGGTNNPLERGKLIVNPCNIVAERTASPALQTDVRAVKEICPSCKGDGEHETGKMLCPTCKGKGHAPAIEKEK